MKPITALNPYDDSWTIKARVAKKEPLRVWEKDGTSRSVFSMELVDEEARASDQLVGPAPFLPGADCPHGSV